MVCSPRTNRSRDVVTEIIATISITVDAQQASFVQRVPGSATAPGEGGAGKLQFQFDDGSAKEFYLEAQD